MAGLKTLCQLPLLMQTLHSVLLFVAIPLLLLLLWSLPFLQRSTFFLILIPEKHCNKLWSGILNICNFSLENVLPSFCKVPSGKCFSSHWCLFHLDDSLCQRRSWAMETWLSASASMIISSRVGAFATWFHLLICSPENCWFANLARVASSSIASLKNSFEEHNW